MNPNSSAKSGRNSAFVPKSGRVSRGLTTVILSSAVLHGSIVGACELRENSFGILVGYDCFLDREEFRLKMPNLIADYIKVNVAGVDIEIGAGATNIGDTNTRGLFALSPSFGPQPNGRFDLELSIQVIDESGSAATFYDHYHDRPSSWAQVKQRLTALDPNESGRINYGYISQPFFTLPDRAQTYMIAVTLFADPHTAMNPKGEIQESNERDNAYVGRASQFYQCLAYGENADPAELWAIPEFHEGGDIEAPLIRPC